MVDLKLPQRTLVPKLHLGTHWLPKLHFGPPAIEHGAPGGKADWKAAFCARGRSVAAGPCEVQLRGQVRSQVQLGNEEKRQPEGRTLSFHYLQVSGALNVLQGIRLFLDWWLSVKSKSSPKAAEDRTHCKTLARGT